MIPQEIVQCRAWTTKSKFFMFFMFLANCCLLMASLTFSAISGITLLFLLILGMILIPLEWVLRYCGAHTNYKHFDLVCSFWVHTLPQALLPLHCSTSLSSPWCPPILRKVLHTEYWSKFGHGVARNRMQHTLESGIDLGHGKKIKVKEWQKSTPQYIYQICSAKKTFFPPEKYFPKTFWLPHLKQLLSVDTSMYRKFEKKVSLSMKTWKKPPSKVVYFS